MHSNGDLGKLVKKYHLLDKASDVYRLGYRGLIGFYADISDFVESSVSDERQAAELAEQGAAAGAGGDYYGMGRP